MRHTSSASELRDTEVENFIAGLRQIRASLDPAFGPETAAPGTRSLVPSAGHCAAVSAILNSYFGGQLVSTVIDGTSHWFNRVFVDGHEFDVDITGDQFGYEPIRILPTGALFAKSRVRTFEELNEETRRRALRLAEKAGLPEIQGKLRLD